MLKLAVLLLCLLSFGCASTEPISPEADLVQPQAVASKPPISAETVKAIDWLDKFYAEYPIGGGWKYEGAVVAEDSRNVIANVSVEYQPKSDDFAKTVCPDSPAEIWKILAQDQDVFINISSDKTPRGAYCNRGNTTG